MIQGLLFHLASRWLRRRGLERVGELFEEKAAASGHVDALHALAKRNLAERKLGDAQPAIEGALARTPNDPTLWCTAGAIYRQKPDFEAARGAYLRALELKPDYPQALSNLGEWSIARGHHEEALDYLARALALAPGMSEARVNRIAALFQLGRLHEAEAEAEALVKSAPQLPEAYVNLGNVQVHLGKGKLGLKNYQKAIELRPGYEEAHFNLATLAGSERDLAEAIGYLESRIQAEGESIPRLGLLATAHKAAGHWSRAEEICRRVLETQPENVTALLTLASCRSDCGHSSEAATLFEQTASVDPTLWGIASSALFELTYLSEMGRAEVFRRHRQWAERYEEPIYSEKDFAGHNRDPERRLRIGYVSGDFCSHPVGYLLRGILPLHDRTRFEVFCYATGIRRDDLTEAIAAASDHWEDVFFLTDDEFAGKVEADQIDILVDLSGHTAFHRLLTFARRPAPVQATWIGYFHSTGMRSIDYFITDPHTTPPGGGQFFSEHAVALPATRFCYTPPDYVPAIEREECSSFTFGSFNRLAKLNDRVIEAWSRILARVPGSRLVLKANALGDEKVAADVRRRFAAAGVAPEQLELRGNSAHPLMFAEYNDIDLALDPFPFTGGMTTLEALWMGVPVLTLIGDTVVSRQSYSALANIGLAEELACPSVEAYVDRAVALAEDRALLSKLRGEMRPRLEASPLRRSADFTRDLEALFRRMWRAWCQGGKLPSDG